MKNSKHVAIAFALALSLLGSSVKAESPESLQTIEVREPAPFAAFGTALLNLAFVPLRLGLTTIGAGLGGFTGFMTGGNEQAADDVWHFFKGQNSLTPEMMQGKEALRIGGGEFSGR